MNWKLAVGNMKAALADLERAGDGMLEQFAEKFAEKLAETARQSASALEAADKRIGEVSSNAEAAVERVRRHAQEQIDDLQVAIARLRVELEAERSQRLASEAAAALARPAHQPEEAGDESEPETSEVPAALLEKRPDQAAEGAAALNFDAAEYARQLLDHLESVYQADETSGIPPADLVERLVANLLYASDVFMRRAGSAGRDADAFQQQLAIALDAKGGTSFGRHLAVAAFEHTQRRKRGGHAQVA